MQSTFLPMIHTYPAQNDTHSPNKSSVQV